MRWSSVRGRHVRCGADNLNVGHDTRCRRCRESPSTRGPAILVFSITRYMSSRLFSLRGTIRRPRTGNGVDCGSRFQGLVRARRDRHVRQAMLAIDDHRRSGHPCPYSLRRILSCDTKEPPIGRCSCRIAKRSIVSPRPRSHPGDADIDPSVSSITFPWCDWLVLGLAPSPSLPSRPQQFRQASTVVITADLGRSRGNSLPQTQRGRRAACFERVANSLDYPRSLSFGGP